jgi:hypothetical protein
MLIQSPPCCVWLTAVVVLPPACDTVYRALVAAPLTPDGYLTNTW